MRRRAFLFPAWRPVAGDFLLGVGARRCAAPLRNAIARVAETSRAQAPPYRVEHPRRTHDLPDAPSFRGPFRIHTNDEGGRNGAGPRSSPPLLPIRWPRRRGAWKKKVRRVLVFTCLSGVRCSKHFHYIFRRRQNRFISRRNAL